MSAHMHKILEKISENREKKVAICNDPQYGNPSDAAEGFDEAYWSLVNQAREEGISDEEISEAAQKGTTQGETDLAGVLEARKM